MEPRRIQVLRAFTILGIVPDCRPFSSSPQAKSEAALAGGSYSQYMPPLILSIASNNSSRDFLQASASGLLARNAASARSIALSTMCQSAAARGFSDASTSSQDVSRSFILAFAPAKSPFLTRADVSTAIDRNFYKSPSFETSAAIATTVLDASPNGIARLNIAVSATRNA